MYVKFKMKIAMIAAGFNAVNGKCYTNWYYDKSTCDLKRYILINFRGKYD
jgi:hypothetical protein